MLKEIKIKTNQKQELIDITGQVRKVVKESGMSEGICLIYSIHTTTVVLLNGDYEEGVSEDILNKLEDLIPKSGSYKHHCIDDNAPAHIKASLIGPSETVIIKDGELVLGTWQGIALAELDGPRTRTILIKLIKG